MAYNGLFLICLHTVHWKQLLEQMMQNSNYMDVANLQKNLIFCSQKKFHTFGVASPSNFMFDMSHEV